VFTERRPVGIQFDLPRAGSTRHYSARLVPDFDANGEIATVLAVTRDITEAAQAQDALRRADRQKDEFLATLAHELRNPLAPVRTGFGVLQRGERTREERRVLDIMDRQLTHLVRLVDELLDIARIGQGKVLLRREVLPLAAVVEQAVDACRPLAEANGHTLTVETADPSWMVHGDLTRLVQVVSNLLTNACKYTPKGGHVRLRAEPQGEELCIVVEDDGLGIPAEALASIFERFVQVQQHQERAQGGLGIGLSVVRSLVEMHGGRVSAESDGPGLGSRFKVWLGRVADTRPLPFTAQEPSAATLVKRTVLIVDDNADAAETLAMLVELQGHEAIVAAGGEEALRLAAARSPHIALVDLGMPGMDGLEVARRMRSLPGGTGFTLVALTGRGTEEDRQRSRAAGFDLHVTKPIQVSHIEELLGARRD
jgi:signal transduction histidine kinase